MLLDTYAQEERFWLTSLFGAPGKPGLQTFRGEFVVLEGELKANAGKRALPKAAIKQAVMVANEDKLLMIAGNFESVDELPAFIARFKGDLAADCVPMFFIDNLGESCQVEIEGNRYILVQFRQGMVWGALTDAFFLDKDDFKGLTGEDKVMVAYEAGKSHASTYPVRTLDEVLAAKTDVKREAWGAV